MTSSALAVLSTRLCPWLLVALGRLEAASTSGRLGHAWLLTGSRGVGKINLALVTAHRLLGSTVGSPPPPAPTPAETVAAMAARHDAADHHPDLHWLFPAPDKRTIAIEQVRDVGEALALKGYHGDAKVVIIEPAEAMTANAANALLKTLEEPTAGSYLLLVSHEPQRLPATVRSRCQRLRVQPPGRAELEQWLGASGETIDAVRRLAGGGPIELAERLIDRSEAFDYRSLESTLSAVSQDKTAPSTVAAEWAKADPAAILEWLLRRLELAVRTRLAGTESTPFTDPQSASLHNAWRALTLRALFEQHQAAGRLLQQVGTGINIELGLHVLLLGFQRERDEL